MQVDTANLPKVLAEVSPLERPCPAENPSCTPGDNTVGLAWDGSAFWASNREGVESGIYRFNKDTLTWQRLFRWKGKHLGAIALDDQALWVVDEELGAMFRIDRQSGRALKGLALPATAVWTPPAVTGLAWDGATLWLLTGCGLCSSFYRIDPNTGLVMQSFFPKCEPRGLAYGTVGADRILWTIAYNGPDHRPRVSRRLVTDDPEFALSSHAIKPFVTDSHQPQYPRDPSALAFDGTSLWVADRAKGGVIFPCFSK